jgi:hypothetical protein
VLSQRGNTALLLACLSGRIDLVRWLVFEAGSDARSERNNVGRCDDAACGCVIDCHFGVRDVLSQRGNTALLLACCNGHLDVARWLVEEAGSDARSEEDEVRYLRSGSPCVSASVVAAAMRPVLSGSMCCRTDGRLLFARA